MVSLIQKIISFFTPKTKVTLGAPLITPTEAAAGRIGQIVPSVSPTDVAGGLTELVGRRRRGGRIQEGISLAGVGGEPVSVARTIQAQEEQVRQEGIVARTIVGQIEAEKPSVSFIGTARTIAGQLAGDIFGISKDVEMGGLPFLPTTTFGQVKSLIREFRIPEKEKVSEVLATITRPIIPSIFDIPRKEAVGAGLTGLEFGVRTTGALFPGTPIETGILIGGAAAFIFAPPIGQLILSGVFAGVGLTTALDPELFPEERVAGGLVAIAGGLGVASIGIPFLRGRFGFGKAVKTAPEGFEFVADVKGVGDIGLIQPGKGTRFVDLPIESPLVRGGFGRTPGGERIFLGTEQFITTSQRAFFKIAKDIPIERPFFVTPQEPFLKIAETRISRLGLIDPFKFPKDIEIGFGLPKTPQIGVTIGEIARTEVGGAFRLGTGTELEAVRTTGIITDITKVGRTRIKGQAVEIFEFKVGKPDKLGIDVGKIEKFDFRTTEVTTRVSGEALVSTLVKTTKGISTGISPLISPIVSPLISPKISPTISPPTIIITAPTLPPITPTLIPPSPPTISPPTISLPIITPPTLLPPRAPPLKPPRRIRLKEKEKRKKKRKRARVIIRPSLTAIVLGIEEPAIILPTLGVLPSQIRGLRTGFEVVRKKKKKKKSKKKKK